MLYIEFKGRYQKEYDELFDLLVPQRGEADSVQGELVRAVRKLERDFYRNGSANFFPNYQALATYLRNKLCLKSIFDTEIIEQIKEDVEIMKRHGRGFTGEDEGCYDRMTDRVVEYCRARPILIWRNKSSGKPRVSIAHVFE